MKCAPIGFDQPARWSGLQSNHRATIFLLSDYLLAVFLGIVEGLTEFLPVSSTAHLRIVEAVLGVDLTSGYWKMFSIVIQLGAILTLPIYPEMTVAEADKVAALVRGHCAGEPSPAPAAVVGAALPLS